MFDIFRILEKEQFLFYNSLVPQKYRNTFMKLVLVAAFAIAANCGFLFQNMGPKLFQSTLYFIQGEMTRKLLNPQEEKQEAHTLTVFEEKVIPLRESPHLTLLKVNKTSQEEMLMECLDIKTLLKDLEISLVIPGDYLIFIIHICLFFKKIFSRAQS